MCFSSGIGRIAIMALIFSKVMPVMADLVHVYECTHTGNVTVRLTDQILETGNVYETQEAPEKSGYIFTHWSINREQEFVNRDAWGRSLDAVSYHLYEDTTLTANYVKSNLDADKDGIPDGMELYWYGNLEESSDSDTDGDGLSFHKEVTMGLNPLFPNEKKHLSVNSLSSGKILYNPNGYAPYVIRSEPAGTLFSTIREYKSPGDVVSTAAYSPKTSKFAYWTINGVRMSDQWGVALESVSFVVSETNEIECVAHCIDDESDRYSWYWHGCPGYGGEDVDNDGKTLMEEIRQNTCPIFCESKSRSAVLNYSSSILQYNPNGYVAYVIRSEPAGALFSTISDIGNIGEKISSPKLSPKTSSFSHWTLNGIRQEDQWGVALEQVVFEAQTNDILLVAHVENDIEKRFSTFWHGTDIQGYDSDVDSDGYTLREEMDMDTSPVFFNERNREAILNFNASATEVNMQIYEQVIGAIVDGTYEQLFTSPIAGNTGVSETFGNGGQIWPVVADVNGDGKWDLVVCWEKESGEVESLEFRVYLNVGSSGNPEFVVGENVSIPLSVDLAMNSTDKLAALTLDVEPINALSATTNGATLLVSDTEGRIWYYVGNGEQGMGNGDGNSSTSSLTHSSTYTLQHKVWGGSHAGFANGLRLAAVDWEDDGDLDCICGTAEGKLILLRNPKVGRPTNLKALAGVDNVLLTWDPNQQSRIRGYKVYRKGEMSDEIGEMGNEGFVALVPGVPNVSSMYTTALPRYRDFPSDGALGTTRPTDFSYKVSSISRFYTAGNSTPTVTESPATEAVSAQLGTVKFFWNDVVCKLGENANVMLSIENSLNYNVADKTQTITYDPEYLRPLKVAPSGLTEGVGFTESFADGKWTISMTSGTLPAGGGKFFTLVFETLKEGETTVGGATVTIAAPNPENPTDVPPYSLGDVTGDGKLDKEDVRELARLKNGNGRKHTANQLKAGDFNGNGKLDNADYQALRDLLKEKGAL